MAAVAEILAGSAEQNREMSLIMEGLLTGNGRVDHEMIHYADDIDCEVQTPGKTCSMSPLLLSSSPDRYSPAPPSPDCVAETPVKNPGSQVLLTPFKVLYKEVTPRRSPRLSRFVSNSAELAHRFSKLSASKSSSDQEVSPPEDPGMPADKFYRSSARVLFPESKHKFPQRKIDFAALDRQPAIQQKRKRSTSNTNPKRKKPASIFPGLMHGLKRPKVPKISPTAVKKPEAKAKPNQNGVRKNFHAKEQSIYESYSVDNHKSVSPTTQRDLFKIDAPEKPFLKTSRQTPLRKTTTQVPDNPPVDPNKKFFKTNRTMEINKTATVTVNKNIKIQVSNGKFLLNNNLLNKKRSHDKAENMFDIDVEMDDNIQDSVKDILDELDDSEERESHVAVNGVKTTPSTIIDDASVLFSNDVNVQNADGGCRFVSQDQEFGVENRFTAANLQDDSQLRSVAPCVIEGKMFESVEASSPLADMSSGEDKGNKENEDKTEGTKYFSLFYKKTTPSRKTLTDMSNETSPPSSKKKRFKLYKPSSGMDQMIIDAGQKEFGATQCSTCSLVYSMGETEDEKMHSEFHNGFVYKLKYSGWKQERVVGIFLDGQVVMVNPGDNKMWWRKVSEVLEVVDRDLGFVEVGIRNLSQSKVLLYISEKQVVGCLVAEPISKAYRILADQEDSQSKRPYCCSSAPEATICGISRIWTLASHRRKNIATRLMNCLRAQYAFGMILSINDMAFSDPSLSGMSFAEKYTGTKSFLVYNQ